jgi:uncharacterized protein
MNSTVPERHPVISLLLIILMVGIGFLLIGPGVGLAVASQFYEGDLLTAIQSNPDYSLFTPLMITQGFASLIGLIIIPALYVVYMERKSFSALFIWKEHWIIILPLIAGIGIGFQVVLSPIVEWNMTFEFPEFLKAFGEWARSREDALIELTKVLTNFQSQQDLLLGFVVIALLPGIGEELVFRGLIQNEIKRGTGNPHLAIWMAAFLFSAIHMQFFGFIPRMMLGALFGYLYHWSGNLIIPMFAHFFHNGFTLLMLYLYQTGTIGLDMESNEAAPWSWVAIATIATLALVYYFRKLYENKSQPRLRDTDFS